MSKLVLIDAFAILHRAFHAIPPLTNKKGEPTNAVYGFVSMILKVVQDLRPDSLAVCFDVKVPTFRHKEFKNYQAQRPAMADELSSQIDKAKDFLKAAKIPLYLKEGYEADDLLGTIAKKAEAESVVVVTGDRDILQLVNEKVKLYMPIVGLFAGKLFGEEETVERMKVLPIQIPDYKALVGDPSDNYPGVAGVGPKTAENLLKKYSDIGKIYAHLNEIEPKLREKLNVGKKDVLLFHRLATIVCDVPVKINFEEMKDWDIDSPNVLKLFGDFGFKTLIERIKSVGKKLDEEKQGTLF